jgi:hypothetical protein
MKAIVHFMTAKIDYSLIGRAVKILNLLGWEVYHMDDVPDI